MPTRGADVRSPITPARGCHPEAGSETGPTRTQNPTTPG